MRTCCRSRVLLSKAFDSRGSSLLRWCAAAWLLGGLCASAKPTPRYPTLSPFDHAERLHEALEEQPPQRHTRVDYERVLNAYRFVYHADPASSKADASISAVAGLLAEEGRLFHSEKILHAAVEQYEFLRREYPASRYRFAGLLAEGEIYRTDLQELDQAKAIFQEFVESYPRNPLAEQARIELTQIREQQSSRRSRRGVQTFYFVETHPAARQIAPSSRAAVAAPTGDTVAAASHYTTPERPAPTPPQRAQASYASQPEEQQGETALPAPVRMTPVFGSEPDELASNRSHRPRVTAIRDWSTANSTRIAINLEDQVEYQTARVLHPDRIYFDLRDAHLARDLWGKSIAVTDDGFLKRIRAAQYSDEVTRIVLDVTPGTDYSAFFLPNPWRLIIDIHGRQPGVASANDVATLGSAVSNSSSVKTVPVPAIATRTITASRQAQGMRPAAYRNAATPNELDALAPAPPPPIANPQNVYRVASVRPLPATGSATYTTLPQASATRTADPQPEDGLSADPAGDDGTGSPAPGMRGTQPAADGNRSLVRTLGLKIGRIVIDAGHGGHDSGTVGPGGIQEKDITLDVALRLGRLLKQRLGYDVIYTRDDDAFIPLEMRTAIANRSHADLFISIHANSSSDPTARGVESYYLNFTTSPEALEVAARENAVSDQSIYQLSDLVKKITLRDKIEESREFAADVQQSLYNGLEAGNPGLKDRGVKKAPFVVLIGANMPSILAEISFLTNPDDARELHQSAYRERIAESLYRGVSRYINGLNGVRLAQNGARPGN